MRLCAQQPSVDVQSYHFRINLPDTGNSIRGIASVLYHAKVGYDDTLRLDLIGMPVRRVFDIYSLRQLPIQYDGRVLRIATRTATVRPLRGIVVEYGGSPQEGLIFRVNARGRRSVFADNWPNRARYWLPVVDHPSDKARVLWSIQIPRGWRAVANQPECRMDGRIRRCNESAPIPTYSMVLGATQQLTRSVHRPVRSGGRTIPIEVLSYPEDSAWADNGPMRRASEIVEALDQLIGPFPYSKLSHVQSTTRFGGAMENATTVFYNERRYVAQSLPEATVRHETAHQWFSNAVTPYDWPHLWLSEGFAVYFGALAGAMLDGPAVFDSTLRAGAASYFNNQDATAVPLIDTAQADPNRLLGANTYQKGAWVLHMLRREVGDSAFFRGIREYYRTYRDSSVTTTQFQRAMERASRDTLGWFFRQWTRQPGYPQLDVAWRSAPQSVVLVVRQAQPAEWGRYRVRRLPIRLALADGRVLDREMTLNERYAEQTHTIMLNPGEEVAELMVDYFATTLLQSTVTRRDVP